ncbi:hypothetical protein TNCV_1643361 [Trichonephila clavipes]|nr:hypothetical protein TNCV_1643361 [Trichonephila clavipes]
MGDEPHNSEPLSDGVVTFELTPPAKGNIINPSGCVTEIIGRTMLETKASNRNGTENQKNHYFGWNENQN